MISLMDAESLNGVDVYYQSLHIIAIYWKITVLLDYSFCEQLRGTAEVS